MHQQTEWLLPESPRTVPETTGDGFGPVTDGLAPRRRQPGGRLPPRESFLKRRLAPIGAALVALVAKFKALLLLLPKLKLLASAGTMLVSIAAYSFVFGWPFAVGFVALLLVSKPLAETYGGLRSSLIEMSVAGVLLLP
ncbi:MAG: hypothetical protein ACTHQQ_00180, partial [Solirubrobacteraceae bacterium]